MTNESFNAANIQFAKIEQPFTIEMFGGWSKAIRKFSSRFP